MSEDETALVNEELCNYAVEQALQFIVQYDAEGYDNFTAIDLLFGAIIQIYKNHDFKPEDVIEEVYERYGIVIQ